ncbi:MAG: hypothetical protein K0Q49_2105, partial [Haloplasmataceae bacterium]|nr:hypothetical protein [Haloplasmataceae bacterium]
TQEEAAVALEKGNVNCIIFINNNFSKLLTDGNTSVIEIYGTKNSTYVEAVVNSYLNTYNLTISLLKNNLPVDQEIQDYKLERGQLNSKGVFPNSLDYYSVQTLLQILMICSVFGVSIILRDINGGLSIRINSLPVKKYQLIIGRLIGCILYSFIAAFVSILFSKYVFKANWDGNLLIISSTILLFVIIVVGIGVLLALITKSNTTSFGIIALLSFILPASVGAFSPKTTVEAIAILSPNYYAKNIIMGSLFDFPNKVIVQGYIGLVIMVVIVYGLIFFFEGRRKYANI